MTVNFRKFAADMRNRWRGHVARVSCDSLTFLHSTQKWI